MSKKYQRENSPLKREHLRVKHDILHNPTHSFGSEKLEPKWRTIILYPVLHTFHCAAIKRKYFNELTHGSHLRTNYSQSLIEAAQLRLVKVASHFWHFHLHNPKKNKCETSTKRNRRYNLSSPIPKWYESKMNVKVSAINQIFPLLLYERTWSSVKIENLEFCSHFI